MTLHFAESARSTVGVEWELMLADGGSGDLLPRAPELLAALGSDAERARYTITGELLTNTLEVTSGVGRTVAEAIGDIEDGVSYLRALTEPRGIELLSAGSHPFAQWYQQEVTDANRYHKLIERTQWWGRNMMIWGIHVHVGVESKDKVLPIITALCGFLPHLQALAASSPFWAAERTGYASNRALVFQQLPTAGLPWDLQTWDQYERYLEDMIRTGVMEGATEVRWDIRPAPHWGTIEVRACDGMSTLPELAAVAAFTQVLVEHFSRILDEGGQLPHLPPWYVRENKWRAARYGLDATVIVDADGTQRPVSEHLADTLESLGPVADDLGCGSEFARISGILRDGASSARQIAVADANDGDLRSVVRHLITEFRQGRPGAR